MQIERFNLAQQPQAFAEHPAVKAGLERAGEAPLPMMTDMACMIKTIERVTQILKFDLRGVEVHGHGVRQDIPPRMESIRYGIIVDTDEPARRLDLLHETVRTYGTGFNTVAPGTELDGVLHRKIEPSGSGSGPDRPG